MRLMRLMRLPRLQAAARLARRLSVFAGAVTVTALAGWVILTPSLALAQSAINLAALRGLVPMSVLLTTPAGQAALASNYSVTAAIQTGTIQRPALQSFKEQQEQALKDAFTTEGNAFQLADGLGTKLGGAYQSLIAYSSDDDGKTSTFTSVSPNVANLIGYTAEVSGADGAVAKYFFGNETFRTKTGATPVSNEAAAILAAAGGTTDEFGKAYRHPAGSPGADPNGDSRPFQTEPNVAHYSGTDYFGVAASNDDYLSGPAQRLVNSPSFPSGHTVYGYTESLLLAILLPDRFSQMIARAAEYGDSRVVLGAHYVMDVLAGRTLAYYDVAHLLAHDPAYVGNTFHHLSVSDYGTALQSAKADLAKALEAACGSTIAACARNDSGRFHDAAANEAFYETTQTYGLATVYPAMARRSEDVALVAPEAGYLLTAAFPSLTLAQADNILTQTEGPGGGFLDTGSAFGLYSRLDLYRAGERAAALRASVTAIPAEPHSR